MEFRILETGPNRFAVEVKLGKGEYSTPYAPPGFSELKGSENTRIFFRDVGRADISEIQETIASWIKEETAPYLSATALKEGAVVQIRRKGELRVTNPK